VVAGGGDGSVAVALPNNGSEAATTTMTTTAYTTPPMPTVAPANIELVSLYMALLQLLQQELSLLTSMRGR
jgi:hypothetical protein